MNKLQIISSGIVKNNPTFVLVLGMCPTLGTTTSAENGMGMGLATMAVLIMSNLVISLIKNIIPDKVRIPAFIVVIASFVTIIQMLMQAYVPALYGALGVFIPLIVVNCIILGRAEAFASKNSPLDSILDGVGIGDALEHMAGLRIARVDAVLRRLRGTVFLPVLQDAQVILQYAEAFPLGFRLRFAAL